LLDEPIAAALAYTRGGLQVGRYVLVYDLGGGTFDLAFLAYDELQAQFQLALQPRGIRRCGGDDLDRALYDYCDLYAQDNYGRPISLTGGLDLAFLRECRRRKEQLSSNQQVSLVYALPMATGPASFAARSTARPSRPAFRSTSSPPYGLRKAWSRRRTRQAAR
jgi:molecular chaperone DnaK (HSP70)